MITMTPPRAPRDGGARSMLIAVRILLVVCLALPVAASTCAGVNCTHECSFDSLIYKPQRCDQCCNVKEGSKDDAAPQNNRLATMETAIGELRVMTGVLLALVLLLLLAVVALFLHVSKTFPTFHLPVFFRNKSDIQEKPPHKPCNGVDPNTTVVIMPNSHGNRSPVAKRASMSKSARGPTEDSLGLHDLEPRPFRTRQPSESTCPEETSDMPEHAYDNLALSTSTLHNTSNSSTDTLGPSVSVNTLETTLPSVNHHPSTDGGTTQV